MCLAEKGMLDGYTQAFWFLQGLPVDIRARIIHKHSISLEKPSMLQFDIFYKAVKSYCVTERMIKEFSKKGPAEETEFARCH